MHTSFPALSRLWRLQSPIFLWALLAPLLSGVLLLWQAHLLAQLIDSSISFKGLQKEVLLTFLPNISLFFLLLIARQLLSYSADVAASLATTRIQHQLRQHLFALFLTQRQVWSKTQAKGALSIALMDQLDDLNGYLKHYLSHLVSALTLPFLFALAVFPIDWIIGLLFLLTAPLIPVFMALIGMGAEKANQERLQVLSRLSGFFSDRIQGLFTLHLFDHQRREAKAIHQANQTLNQADMKVLKIAFLSSAVLELFAALGVAGVAVYIGLAYLGMLGSFFTPLSLAQGLFCLLLAPEVYQPLRNLAASYHDRATAKTAYQKIQVLLEDLDHFNQKHPLHEASKNDDNNHPINSKQSSKVLLVQANKLELMSAKGQPLIRPTSFNIHQGEHWVITGRSGSGKTTLLNTLLGLHPFYKGQLKTFFKTDEALLLSAHSFISQSTIREFLQLAKPQATDELLWEALAWAQLKMAVQALEQQLDTPLGNRGYGLSGGQAQRLILARIYLSDAKLLVLDEPTLYLDEQTKQKWIHKLLAFAQDKTLIITTHDRKLSQYFDVHYHFSQQALVRQTSDPNINGVLT